jgi:hypothetical protein
LLKLREQLHLQASPFNALSAPLNFHQVFLPFFTFIYQFFPQDVWELSKNFFLRPVDPQTSDTNVVITTPDLVGYTWMDCSIRAGQAVWSTK